jgi:hypothetical protein
MAFRGVLDALGANYMPFEGRINIKYLTTADSPTTAQRALDFMAEAGNQFDLVKYHSPDEIKRMWRGVFRSAIAHGVLLTNEQKSYARQLGVVL